MKIAVAQINTRAGDFEETIERMADIVRTAVSQGAELVVFPMTVLTGALPVAYALRDGHHVDLLNALFDLASEVSCPCLVPVVSILEGETYHEVMLLKDADVVALRARAYLETRERGTKDGASQAPSSGAPITRFELDGLSFCIAMTYEDIDDLVEAQVDCDVVVYVSDYSYALDDPSSALGAALGENRFKVDAVSLDTWFVAAGSLGGYGIQVYSGSSFVMSPNGDLVACAPAFEEDLLFSEVNPWLDASELLDGMELLEPELYNRSLHLWEALTTGLHDYLHKQDKSDVALVLDGSLASSLLAVLASDALGPMRVHAILGATDDARGVALATANALHLECIPLLGVLDDDEDSVRDAALVRLAAEVRRTGAVPLDAVDKTFLAMEVRAGRCHVAEFLPFGDVYRSDLVELAHMRNTISPVLPTEAFARFELPYVPGLEEIEPTREMQLKRVDVTLSTHVEWERTLSDVALRQGEPEVTAHILWRLYACEASRLAWPPALTVSSQPLSLLHMPVGYAWFDRVRSGNERAATEMSSKQVLPTSGVGQLPADAVPGFEELLQSLGIELQEGGVPEGMSRETVAGTVGELMGLLQDMIQNSDQPPTIEGPFGPLTWGSPFSEN